MNWFQRIFSAAKRRGYAEIKRISQLDGKAGLTLGDIEILLGQIRKLATIDAAGSEKHRMAVAWLVERLGQKIPRGFAEVIVFLAYSLIRDQLKK